MSLFTFKDFTDHLSDFLGGSGDKDGRDYRRAAALALREVTDMHPWTYYSTYARLNVTAPYDTGTIAYTSSTRTVALAGGTWPEWTIDGTIDMDGIRCEVESVPSSTTLTLPAHSCPPGDITAGTEYTLHRDSYLAPSNFYKPLTGLRDQGTLGYGPEYVEAPYLRDPYLRTYTIVGSSNYQGMSAFRFDPPPEKDQSYEYWYRRHPRELLVEGDFAGSVSVSSSSSTVTGVGTSFSQRHVGCSIRTSVDTEPPTSVSGDNPMDVERVVMSVESPTSLTVDAPYNQSASNIGYILSDPVDIAPYMLDCLLRTAEVRLCMLRNRMDGLPTLRNEREAAWKRSASADSKSAGRRWVGRGNVADEWGFRNWTY